MSEKDEKPSDSPPPLPRWHKAEATDEAPTPPDIAAQKKLARHRPPPEHSPRLRRPAHHRAVRPGASRRRRAIRAAGLMLLTAAALGLWTAAGVILQAGQVSAPPPPQGLVEVSGTVMNVSGVPIPGADVRALGTSNESTTNSLGGYYLGSLAPGVYTIETSAAGYKTVRRTVEVSPGFPRMVDFALPEGDGTVEGPNDRVAAFADPAAGHYVLATAMAICSALAFVGGISAVFQRHYLLAVAGAAAGVLTVGPSFLGSFLSLAALAILGSLKTGFLEVESHRIPWEGKGEPKGAREAQPAAEGARTEESK